MKRLVLTTDQRITRGLVIAGLVAMTTLGRLPGSDAHAQTPTPATMPSDISEAFGKALDVSPTPVPGNSAPLNLNAPTETVGMRLEPTPATPLDAQNFWQPAQTEYVPEQLPLDIERPAGSAAPFATVEAGVGCVGETIGPQSPRNICGFHCVGEECECTGGLLDPWCHAGPIPWEAFAQGDYVGPARTAHVPEYRLRVDDSIEFVYRVTGETDEAQYRVQIGDLLRLESLGAPEQNRDEVTVQPDGFVTLSIVGEVRAAGRTISEITQELERAYSKEIKNPRITVAPTQVNTVLEELRNSVDNRGGRGGQSRIARVTPSGTVQLPAIGSVHAQGLTLAELQREIHAAYSEVVSGVEITPILEKRAPRFVYVLGEVDAPGRFTLEGPTTVLQAISLAGSWNLGADLRHVIIFRRDDNWNLMATKLNLQAALYGRDPCPAGEVWLRDSDIIMLPKHPILVIDEAIELVFTRGIYSVFPVFFTNNLVSL